VAGRWSIEPTPLVELGTLNRKGGVRLLAKLEWQLPTGSVKDRPAVAMMADARERGLLTPGVRLLEPSSGNTGIALARLARLAGIHLTVVAPSNISPERKQLLRSFGAELIESPGEEGSNGAIAFAGRMHAEGDWLMLDQYSNPANPLSHELTTGPEILGAVERVDVLVAALGTGGTLMGTGRSLRRAHPDVKVIAVEPPAGEAISGLRSLEDGYVPPIFDPNQIDGKILVRTAQAVAMTRRLLDEEGLFAGLSSGAVVHAALKWVERLDTGVVVAILPDGGWKYLSFDVWGGTIDDAAERVGGSTYF